MEQEEFELLISKLINNEVESVVLPSMIIDNYDKLFDKAGFKYIPNLSEYYGWDFSFYYKRNEVIYCFSRSAYYGGFCLSIK